MPERIDGHLHIWSDDATAYPWRPIHGAEPPVGVPGAAEYVLDVLARHGMARAVVVQTRAYGDDHRYLSDALAGEPGRVIAVAALDPADPEGPSRLAELAKVGYRGLRLDALGAPCPWLEDGTVVPIWDAAADLGLAIEVMALPDQLPALEPLTRRTPGTPVIVEHLARYGAPPGTGLDTLRSFARLPNAVAKVSALSSISAEPPPHQDIWPLIRDAVRAFGAARLMWGSDMPWIGADGYAAEMGTIEGLPFLDAAGRDAILGGTAAAVFGAVAARSGR